MSSGKHLPALAVAVDLTPLRPGGENGGVKPAIFSLLAEAARQQGEAFVFVFLTNSATHDEVRRLARPWDLLVCVLHQPESPVRLDESGEPAEFSVHPAPKDLVRRIGADVLYCPFGSATYHAPGVPVVALIADLLHRDYPFSLTAPEIAHREAFVTKTIRAAAKIQCISRSGVEQMMAHYQVPEEKLFSTYLPVQLRLETQPEAAGDVLRKSGIAAPYFFYPANLWKHKNHETLLLAYRLYRERAGDAAWDLVLTFHEDQRAAEIRELARALGIADHLRLPGYVADADLRALWQNAGALVFPSLHEGFGIPLVEAMHFGVPILAGSDFSLREIGGDACLGMDPRKPESIANGLLRMAGGPALRQELVCRGRRRLAAFFNLEIEALKLVNALRAVAGRRDGFPRRPQVLEQPYFAAVPTPASEELWSFAFQVSPAHPQNRYTVFLDDAAFGSFSFRAGEVFCLQCRPLGRTLRVAISRDRTVPEAAGAAVQGGLEEIRATRPGGEIITLFTEQTQP